MSDSSPSPVNEVAFSNLPRLASARVLSKSGGATQRSANASPAARGRVIAVALVLVGMTPAVMLLAVTVGAAPLPLGEVWRSLSVHLTGQAAPLALTDQIVWEIRLPRVLTAYVVGAGLATAGAVLQAVMRNPLADPYILGVASGASLGAVAVLTLGGIAGTGVLATLGVSGAAFAGALITLLAVLLLGRRAGGLDPNRLLLAGVALSYLLQAGTSFLQLRVSNGQLSQVLFWLLGTVANADWQQLALPALLVVTAVFWLASRSRGLNALLLGDDAATSLGIPVERFRLQLLIVSAALTAAVISIAGGVGFVGLVAPHCVRLLVGADHRRVLPLSALLGGGFLVLADLLGRTIVAPLELPLSVITAVAGVPFFLILLHRSSRTAIA